jgi:hypothetical protein
MNETTWVGSRIWMSSTKEGKKNMRGKPFKNDANTQK